MQQRDVDTDDGLPGVEGDLETTPPLFDLTSASEDHLALHQEVNVQRLTVVEVEKEMLAVRACLGER